MGQMSNPSVQEKDVFNINDDEDDDDEWQCLGKETNFGHPSPGKGCFQQNTIS